MSIARSQVHLLQECRWAEASTMGIGALAIVRTHAGRAGRARVAQAWVLHLHRAAPSCTRASCAGTALMSYVATRASTLRVCTASQGGLILPATATRTASTAWTAGRRSAASARCGTLGSGVRTSRLLSSLTTAQQAPEMATEVVEASGQQQKAAQVALRQRSQSTVQHRARRATTESAASTSGACSCTPGRSASTGPTSLRAAGARTSSVHTVNQAALTWPTDASCVATGCAASLVLTAGRFIRDRSAGTASTYSQTPGLVQSRQQRVVDCKAFTQCLLRHL